MGRNGVIALLSCVFALCLALAGCGDNSAAAKAAFTGTWNLVEMSQGDEVTGADELDTLKSLGMEVYVNLNEDGTSALVLFGDVIEGTWEASSTTSGTITMQDAELTGEEAQKVNMTIADSRLTFEQQNAKLTFEKGEAKEVPSGDDADGEEAADEATAEEAADEAAASEDEAAPADEAASADETAPADATAASEDEAAPADEAAGADEAAEQPSSSSSSAQ